MKHKIFSAFEIVSSCMVTSATSESPKTAAYNFILKFTMTEMQNIFSPKTTACLSKIHND